MKVIFCKGQIICSVQAKFVLKVRMVSKLSSNVRRKKSVFKYLQLLSSNIDCITFFHKNWWIFYGNNILQFNFEYCFTEGIFIECFQNSTLVGILSNTFCIKIISIWRKGVNVYFINWMLIQSLKSSLIQVLVVSTHGQNEIQVKFV